MLFRILYNCSNQLKEDIIMTLNDIFEHLCAIDCAAQALLGETGFTSDDGLGSKVRLKPDDPDDRFLRNKAEELLDSFQTLHEELQYLSTPSHGEHTLQLLPNGRYGYYDRDGEVRIFTCGKTFEAKIRDNYGRQHWTRTRIEHDGSDYFLWGHGSVPLSGLTVRERW